MELDRPIVDSNSLGLFQIPSNPSQQYLLDRLPELFAQFDVMKVAQSKVQGHVSNLERALLNLSSETRQLTSGMQTGFSNVMTEMRSISRSITSPSNVRTDIVEDSVMEGPPVTAQSSDPRSYARAASTRPLVPAVVSIKPRVINKKQQLIVDKLTSSVKPTDLDPWLNLVSQSSAMRGASIIKAKDTVEERLDVRMFYFYGFTERISVIKSKLASVKVDTRQIVDISFFGRTVGFLVKASYGFSFLQLMSTVDYAYPIQPDFIPWVANDPKATPDMKLEIQNRFGARVIQLITNARAPQRVKEYFAEVAGTLAPAVIAAQTKEARDAFGTRMERIGQRHRTTVQDYETRTTRLGKERARSVEDRNTMMDVDLENQFEAFQERIESEDQRLQESRRSIASAKATVIARVDQEVIAKTAHRDTLMETYSNSDDLATNSGNAAHIQGNGSSTPERTFPKFLEDDDKRTGAEVSIEHYFFRILEAARLVDTLSELGFDLTLGVHDKNFSPDEDLAIADCQKMLKMMLSLILRLEEDLVNSGSFDNVIPNPAVLTALGKFLKFRQWAGVDLLRWSEETGEWYMDAGESPDEELDVSNGGATQDNVTVMLIVSSSEYSQQVDDLAAVYCFLNACTRFPVELQRAISNSFLDEEIVDPGSLLLNRSHQRESVDLKEYTRDLYCQELLGSISSSFLSEVFRDSIDLQLNHSSLLNSLDLNDGSRSFVGQELLGSISSSFLSEVFRDSIDLQLNHSSLLNSLDLNDGSRSFVGQELLGSISSSFLSEVFRDSIDLQLNHSSLLNSLDLNDGSRSFVGQELLDRPRPDLCADRFIFDRESLDLDCWMLRYEAGYEQEVLGRLRDRNVPLDSMEELDHADFEECPTRDPPQPIPSTVSPPPFGERSNLKIACYNIQGYGRNKHTLVSRWMQGEPEIIAAESPDILFLLETWTRIQEDLSGHPYLLSHVVDSSSTTSARGTGGLAVLATQELRAEVKVLMSTKNFISIKVRNRVITCAYFPPSLDSVKNGIKDTLELIPRTDILLGDLNYRDREFGDRTSTNPVRRKLIQDWAGRQNLEVVRNVNEDDDHPRNDWVLSRGIEVTWIYRNLPQSDPLSSDHGIMSLDVTFHQAPTRHAADPRYSLKPFDTPAMRGLLCDIFEKTRAEGVSRALSRVYADLRAGETPGDHQEVVDQVYKILDYSIYDFCEEALISYDPESVKSQTDDTIALSNSDCSTRRAIRVWKRSMRVDAALNQIQARDPDLTAQEEAQIHYSTIFETTRPGLDDPPPDLEDDLNMDLADSLDAEEVEYFISNYPGAKSGGLDYWASPRLLKILVSECPSLLEAILALFRICCATGRVPRAWLAGKLHLLQKDPKQPFPDKSRPINLSSFLRRIFEKVLMAKEITFSKPWVKIDNYQAGFRPGYSTISHLLLADQLPSDGYPESVFLDLKSAYDLVPWSRLLEILRSNGCPSPVLRLIQSLALTPAALYLSLNQTLGSTPLITSRGLFQGSCLSPFLFLIFIDELAKRLKLTGTGLITLLFADDILLQIQDSVAELALEVCQTWAVENGMTWGVAKCGSTLTRELRLAGQVLPMVTDKEPYKYLGCPHGRRRILWEEHARIATETYTRTLGAVSDRAASYSVFTRLVIWRTFYRPKVEYAMAPAVIFGQLSKRHHGFDRVQPLLEGAYKRGIQFVVRSRKYSQVMSNVLGLGSFQNRVDQLQASLARHLRSLDPQNPFRRLLTRPRDQPMSLTLKSTVSDFLRRFDAYCLSLPPPPPTANPRKTHSQSYAWKSFCKLETLAIGTKSNLRLEKYIATTCRLRMNPMDACVHQPDPIGREAVVWRIGHCFHGKRCPICLGNFNRRHIIDCNLLSEDSQAQITIASVAFKDRQAKVATAFTSVTQLRSKRPHYTVLDFHLDVRQYGEFHRIFSLISTILSSAPATQ
jgi:hypothetical protein